MLDHIQSLDATIRQLCKAVRSAGIDPGELRLDELKGCELHSAASKNGWPAQRDDDTPKSNRAGTPV